MIGAHVRPRFRRCLLMSVLGVTLTCAATTFLGLRPVCSAEPGDASQEDWLKRFTLSDSQARLDLIAALPQYVTDADDQVRMLLVAVRDPDARIRERSLIVLTQSPTDSLHLGRPTFGSLFRTSHGTERIYAACLRILLEDDLETFAYVRSRLLCESELSANKALIARILRRLGARAAPACPELLEFVRGSDAPDARSDGFSALAGAGPTGIDALVGLLSDPSTCVADAVAAVNALVSVGPPARERLHGALMMSPLSARGRIAQAIEGIGPVPEMRGDLISLLTCDDPFARMMAARCLGAIAGNAPESTIADLVRATNDRALHVQNAAAIALWRLGYQDEAAKCIFEQMDNGHFGWAAACVSEIGSACVPLLEANVNSEAPSRRQGVARALGKCGAVGLDGLRQLSADSDADVGYEVIRGLTTIAAESTGRCKAVKILHSMLEHRLWLVQNDAAAALFELTGSMRARSRLRRLLTEDGIPAELVKDTLWGIAVRTSIVDTFLPEVLGCLGHADASVRQEALAVIGSMRGPPFQIAPFLVDVMLNDDDESVCRSAIDALGEIGASGRSVIRPLCVIVADESRDEDTRETAAYMVGQLAEAGELDELTRTRVSLKGRIADVVDEVIADVREITSEMMRANERDSPTVGSEGSGEPSLPRTEGYP